VGDTCRAGKGRRDRPDDADERRRALAKGPNVTVAVTNRNLWLMHVVCPLALDPAFDRCYFSWCIILLAAQDNGSEGLVISMLRLPVRPCFWLALPAVYGAERGTPPMTLRYLSVVVGTVPKVTVLAVQKGRTSAAPIVTQERLFVVVALALVFVVALVLVRLYHQNKGKRDIIHELNHYDVKERNHLERKYAEYASAFVLVLTIGLAYGVRIYNWPTTLIPAAIALWAVWLGYSQFIDIRNENSIDKFYDRLKLTNQKLDDWPATRILAGPWYDRAGSQIAQDYAPSGTEDSNANARDAYRLTMYVCLELDNLESALVKYAAGYMSSSNTLRSVRTFKQRCDSDKAFKTIVEKLCADQKNIQGGQAGHMTLDRRGYNESTLKTATKLAKGSSTTTTP